MVFKYDHNENINTPSKSVFLNRRATAGCRVPGAGPWHQLYRAARGLRKLKCAARFH